MSDESSPHDTDGGPKPGIQSDTGRAASQSEPAVARDSEPPVKEAKEEGRRLKWRSTPIAPSDLLLSVVMPVYNEESTLEAIVERVREVDVPKELILVDDGSTDASLAILAELEKQDGIRVFRHEKNRGKGAALKTGFAEAKGNVVIIQDADMEYDPHDYIALLKPIVEGRADVVYGSRFLVREYARVHLFSHYLGNRFLTFVSNVFTGLNLTDMETCYKVFRSEVVKDLDVKSRRFDVEPEMTAKVAKKKLRIYEVPVSYAGRDFEDGKKISWRDGFTALWAIVKFRFTN